MNECKKNESFAGTRKLEKKEITNKRTIMQKLCQCQPDMLKLNLAL